MIKSRIAAKPLQRVLLLGALCFSLGGCPNPTEAELLSSDNAITEFRIKSPAATGVIDEAAGTISVTLPYGTMLTSLQAIFTTKGEDVAVGAIPQNSGTTRNDFSSPVVYTVTAADGSTARYRVIITTAASSAKALKALSFAGFAGSTQTASISESAKTATCTLPYLTDLGSLVAIFETTGQSVKIGTVSQLSGVTPNDFSAPKTYTITAADGSSADYRVVVSLAKCPYTDLTSFSFIGRSEKVVRDIWVSPNTFTTTIPYGTDRNLVAVFTTTGAKVTVGGIAQVSGTTSNDFSTSKTYRVTAEDGRWQDFAVSVLWAAALKEITSFGIAGISDSRTVIDQAARTIVVSVPAGTDRTALTPTFEAPGTGGLRIGSLPQVSGQTSNDFSNSGTAPLVYTLDILDGSSVEYSVQVLEYLPLPVISVSGDPVAQVSISCADPAADVYYSTDGSTPSTESTLYSGAFSFPGKIMTLCVRAIAATASGARSREASEQAGNAVSLDLVPSSSVVAGNYQGYAEGIATAAKFYDPFELTSDGINLYVADTGNNRIRKVVIATGEVSTLAGSGTAGFAEGIGAAASFNRPTDVATDGTHVFVADNENHRIRKIVIATGEVSTLAGDGVVDSSAKRIGYPTSIATDGSYVYAVDTYMQIRRISIATGDMETLFKDSSLSNLMALACDGANLYFEAYTDYSIHRYSLATGTLSLLAGSGSAGDADGTGAAASFRYINSLDSDGTYLYASTSGLLRRIGLATGIVTTVFSIPKNEVHSMSGIASDGARLFYTDRVTHQIRVID